MEGRFWVERPQIELVQMQQLPHLTFGAPHFCSAMKVLNGITVVLWFKLYCSSPGYSTICRGADVLTEGN